MAEKKHSTFFSVIQSTFRIQPKLTEFISQVGEQKPFFFKSENQMKYIQQAVQWCIDTDNFKVILRELRDFVKYSYFHKYY